MAAERNEQFDRILAELIDELVFEERQRIFVEEKMGLHVEELTVLAQDLVQGVRNMCEYTLALEEEVFPVLVHALAPGDSPDPQRVQRLDEERARMVHSLLTVRAAVGEDADRVAASTPPPASESPKASGSGEDDSKALAAGAKLARNLLKKKLALLSTLDDVHALLGKCSRRSQSLAAAQSTPLREDSPGDPLPRLDRSPDSELADLRRQVQQLGEELRRHVPAKGGSPPSKVLTWHEEPRRESPPRAEVEERSGADAARLRAYEMTVQALNVEIASVTERLATSESEYKAQLERLQREKSEMESRHDERLAECDTALCRVSLELEQLIKENARLKRQLRALQ